MRIPFLIAVSVLAFAACTTTPHSPSMPPPKQTARVFKTTASDKVQLNYLLFLPESYNAKSSKQWPLILFLHGIGERGSDPWKVKVHGPPKVAEKMSNFPFIVVSPQCPNGEWWSNRPLIALLDQIIADYKVDTNRVYLSGLSMGGFGAWNLALEFPERFAAVAPICGGGNPYYPNGLSARRKAALKSLPFWVFHGDKDESVGIGESERMVNGLKRFGCDVKFTVYPGVGHDSWTQTYSDRRLYEWFLEHVRGS